MTPRWKAKEVRKLVKYKGKNIAEVLNMFVDEALDFFKNIPKIEKKQISR